jgi:hypothetical protein
VLEGYLQNKKDFFLGVNDIKIGKEGRKKN